VHGDESAWLGEAEMLGFPSPVAVTHSGNAWYAIETEEQLNGDAIKCTASSNSDLGSLINQIGAATGVAGWMPLRPPLSNAPYIATWQWPAIQSVLSVGYTGAHSAQACVGLQTRDE